MPELVDRLLAEAASRRASDLHIEPGPDCLRIRLRVEGALSALPSPPATLGPALAGRIKALAGMDASERRRPQDGRLCHGGAEFRVSTLPVHGGEAVVLRLLDSAGARRRELGSLGLPEALEAGLRRAVGRPHGLLLATGPTGSGKTTTLDALLRHIHRPDIKVLTVEDPVEYELPGAVQVAARPEAGLGFAEVLRSFLRHDPDVILVGEIRDRETAALATQAALTGHLVLSSLHCASAPGAVPRLVDLGVERAQLALALVGVLGQRLLRRLCPDCKSWRMPAPEETQALEAAGRPGVPAVATGTGCPACAGTGQQGRIPIYEWLEPDAALRESMLRDDGPDAWLAAARRSGWSPLAAAAAELVARGDTSVAEAIRHA